MSRQPFFSVITPTYNHRPFITACIESVMAQTFADWEMIVIDDASSDNTAGLVRDLLRREPRLKLIAHDASWGIARLDETYNQGLAAAAGEWIAVLEGDDFWPADKLAIQHEQCRRIGAVVCFGKCRLVSPGGAVLAGAQQSLPRSLRRYFRDYCGPMTRPLLLGPSFIHPVTAVIHALELRRIGGFRRAPGLQLTDHPTLLELSLLGPFFGSSRQLGFYRRHAGSQSLVRIVELTAGEKELAFAFHARSEAARPGAAGGRRFAGAMRRGWGAATAGGFWVDGRRRLAAGDTAPARAMFLKGALCRAAWPWPGWRTLKFKAACLAALACLILGVDPERLVARLTGRRRSLLQEALLHDEP